jgi:glycosyltransferase involved in cell wall biosynthesis
MSAAGLTYALVTPARDESWNLRRLAACIERQSSPPKAWVIVDNGSTDDTTAVVDAFRATHPWVRLVRTVGDAMQPGAPVVRAFHAGLEELREFPDVVVKLDADVSFGDDYFERILDAFARDPALGIAGGICLELEDGEWIPKHVTGDHVRGATRAYRRACLIDVLPLPEIVGWDGVDELKANVLGWRTASLEGLPFHHHRKVGSRDGARTSRWLAEGRCAHYMGYGLLYQVVRTFGRAVRDRDPAAFAMLWSYLLARASRQPQYPDRSVREHLRRQQSVRALPLRVREALGRR